MVGGLSATSVGKVSNINSFYRGTSWFILMTGKNLTEGYVEHLRTSAKFT
jgi:hypothetical protein